MVMMVTVTVMVTDNVEFDHGDDSRGMLMIVG